MASKTLFIILAMLLIAVAFAQQDEEIPVEDEDLSVQDLLDYFQMPQIEKRGSKVGECIKPDGKPCALCNLKVRNKMDMRRYIACGSAGKGRKI